MYGINQSCFNRLYRLNAVLWYFLMRFCLSESTFIPGKCNEERLPDGMYGFQLEGLIGLQLVVEDGSIHFKLAILSLNDANKSCTYASFDSIKPLSVFDPSNCVITFEKNGEVSESICVMLDYLKKVLPNMSFPSPFRARYCGETGELEVFMSPEGSDDFLDNTYPLTRNDELIDWVKFQAVVNEICKGLNFTFILLDPKSNSNKSCSLGITAETSPPRERGAPMNESTETTFHRESRTPMNKGSNLTEMADIRDNSASSLCWSCFIVVLTISYI